MTDVEFRDLSKSFGRHKILENISLDIKTGAGLTVLESLRGTMPYWATILPVCVIAAVSWIARKSNSSDQRPRECVLDWIPGISRAVFEERVAIFSETVAKLLETGVAFPEALKTAAGTWNRCGL